MTIAELTIKTSCQDLIHRFCHALDRGASAEAADLIADDAVALRPDGELIRGRAVREMLLNRPSTMLTRHLISNVVVEPTGTDSADAVAYVVAYRVASDTRFPTRCRLLRRSSVSGAYNFAAAKTCGESAGGSPQPYWRRLRDRNPTRFTPGHRLFRRPSAKAELKGE